MDILQGVHNFFKHIRIFLLLLVSLVQEIHGTEIQFHGLNIEHILSANGISQNIEVPKDAKHLPPRQLLRIYYFHKCRL